MIQYSLAKLYLDKSKFMIVLSRLWFFLPQKQQGEKVLKKRLQIRHQNTRMYQKICSLEFYTHYSITRLLNQSCVQYQYSLQYQYPVPEVLGEKNTAEILPYKLRTELCPVPTSSTSTSTHYRLGLENVLGTGLYWYWILLGTGLYWYWIVFGTGFY